MTYNAIDYMQDNCSFNIKGVVNAITDELLSALSFIEIDDTIKFPIKSTLIAFTKLSESQFNVQVYTHKKKTADFDMILDTSVGLENAIQTLCDTELKILSILFQ